MTSALTVFSTRGYARTTFVEVAQASGVPMAQLFHLFPGGRPQLVTAVARTQLDELVRELRRAARVPFPAKARLERFLERMFDYVLTHPGTYRLLFDGAVRAADHGLAPLATAARTELTAEVAGLLAGTAPVDEVAAASVGIVGFALANIGLCLSGVVDPEQAKAVTCEFCTSRLPGAHPEEK